MNLFSMRPAFHGYSSSKIVGWYYERAWSTLNGAKRAIVARTVDLYTQEIAPAFRTIKFNLPEDPDDSEQFLACNKKNIKIVDDFFADNSLRSKHFRDNLEIYIARAIDEIFDAGICDILKQKLFPEQVVPQTEGQLDQLLVDTNSSYTAAVNECVRVFRNGLGDDTEEELEILESKLLSAREMLDKNVGVIEHELKRRKSQK